MQIKVRYLDNLKVEARFDDFTIIADQPVRYKGDGLAPGPFDYFLASSAMCAAYFVKVYCLARNISTEDIEIIQDNIVDPENRYNQTFQIHAHLPESLSEKDREGILAAIERCTVKKVIQQNPKFEIVAKTVLGKDTELSYDFNPEEKTFIRGKDLPLESTIAKMTKIISDLGIKLEITSWRNLVPHVWSVHLRDADCPMNFTNGKGSTKDAALCSALGEFIERVSSNYFYSDFYLGPEIAESEFVHYPQEKWFKPGKGKSLPEGLMDNYTKQVYHLEGQLKSTHLYDTNSGHVNRGICALPFVRQSDQEVVYIPVNLIGNLFVSNGMSAGNSLFEARVQCLSEIFERAVKNKIISEEIALPDVPKSVLEKYPTILEGIEKLEKEGFPIFIKDASLGGRYPVMCVTLMNPKTGGAYASFGAHPIFEVALERSLTELLQGRSFEGLNDMPAPTFNELAVQDHNNIIDHFIDSTGVISWKFFSKKSDYDFVEWDFSGSTEEEFNYLMSIFKHLEKEVYIADYEELGAKACRILVPGYSEIYLPEEIIWNNNNEALLYREDVLNLHRLKNDELVKLLEKLDQCEHDDFYQVSELIGVTFEESSVWGQLVLAELKLLIHLALKNTEEAKMMVEVLRSFNNNSLERRKLYRSLETVLDIELNPDLDINDFIPALKKMNGDELVDQAIQMVAGELRFHGLTETDSALKGLDKHLRLIESYKKLHSARSKNKK
jgi:ribosomal protein S12 methylthiotransferase accessory factor